jgi:Fe-S oxidoreductase
MIIENVILTTDNCRYCLMCRHVCPVGHVTRKETFTPHGWGLVIASVRRGLLQWNPETVGVLYSCADCGTCRAHCVTDQPLPEAIAASRAEVAALDLAPPVVYQVHAALQSWGNPYREQSPETAGGHGEVALFVGDEAHYLWPSVVGAALRLLEAIGVYPVLVGIGRNNGYLASSLGFPETARALQTATLDELRSVGATRMLVLGPGDYDAFSRMADERLGLTWPEDIELVELTNYLASRLEAGDLRLHQASLQGSAAYVDPTHTVRHPERSHAPRRLLQAIHRSTGQELFWRQDRAHPVGNVALQFTNPQIADHLNTSRLADVTSIGANLAICEDPGTLSQLSRHASRFGVEVISLYELLSENIELT